MLHELLFALQGYPGSIFIEKDSTFSVSKGLSFLHPSEAEVLNKLCSLDYAVKYYKAFQLSCSLLQSEDETWPNGFASRWARPRAMETRRQSLFLVGKRVGMSYQVKWPLHVFLTESAMAKYLPPRSVC
uniref:Putative similar to gamma-tubulin complex component 4 gcp-4 n=1 Tax=Ixodes ricinus TaxID=34613 RepID=A0A0K8RAY2_IXORI